MGIETLLLVAIVASVASTGMTAYNQMQSAKYEKKLADYNAAVANNNAVNAEKWAQYNESREREKQRYARGKMLTQYMKAGVILDENQTSGLVLQDQVVQDELDALAIRTRGQGEAIAYRNQAALSTFQGQQALAAGKRQAIGTVVSGIGQTAILAASAGGKAAPRTSVSPTDVESHVAGGQT